MRQDGDAARRAPERIGRYLLYGAIARGGMATVHAARAFGDADFARIVAAKRLHPHVAAQPELVAMFRDEARLASRVAHPNVIAPRDVIEADGELLVIFDYVHGESLARLSKGGRKDAGARAPLAVASAIGVALLRGLAAAHAATAPDGAPLGIIHRDVSPENVLVGADGVARLVDFGVAKANARLASTREGELKGKLAYTAPELLRGRGATRATDIYSAGVVLWETFTGRRLFTGENEAAIVERVLVGLVEPPSAYVARAPEALDALVARALEHEPSERFASAGEMADALAAAVPPAMPEEVAAWVKSVAADALAARAALIASIEASPAPPAPPAPPASPAPPAPRARRRAPIAALVVGAGAVCAIAVAARSPAPAASRAPAEPAPASPAPEPAAPELTPAAPDPARDPASAAEIPEPAERAAPARARWAPARGATSAASARARSADAPRGECAVPYKLDALGRKVYKRECL